MSEVKFEDIQLRVSALEAAVRALVSALVVRDRISADDLLRLLPKAVDPAKASPTRARFDEEIRDLVETIKGADGMRRAGLTEKIFPKDSTP